MPQLRRLIVNADDLGSTAEINRGILEGHERGIVTSASLMVDRPGVNGVSSRYTVEREQELRTLTDPRVRAHVEELGIALIGWREL